MLPAYRVLLTGLSLGAILLLTAIDTPQDRPVTSSTLTLHWNPIPGAKEIHVYLLADPRGEKMLLATLPPAATTYKVTNMAPAATAFLRVEADTADSPTSSWTLRTAGGPRAMLDNPVREIHEIGRAHV